jgi:hypothetical protein
VKRDELALAKDDRKSTATQEESKEEKNQKNQKNQFALGKRKNEVSTQYQPSKKVKRGSEMSPPHETE